MIECRLCSNKFKVISSTHLKIQHSLSIKKYKEQYGEEGVGFLKSIAEIAKTDKRYKLWRESLLQRDTGWARGYTKETHPSIAKMVETFRRKKIDNFKKWREAQREKGLMPLVNEPLKEDSNLAFLVGLVLGDGNITRFPRTECLRIALAEKYPGLITHTARIVKKVFKKVPNVRKVTGSACYTVTLYQNNISHRLGIPVGNRADINFSVPDWISTKRNFLLSFIRGLFEAEGSLSVHLPTYTYNFQFSNKNPSLLNIVQKSLELLGYHPEVRPVAVRLRRKAEVERFKELIRFRIY